jgi:hypothetical protein
MSPSRNRRKPAAARPFVWQPGIGVDDAAVERMRDQFRRPAVAMGEAWFMGERRRMYDWLLGDLRTFTVEQLRDPLEEIASGNSSFGPMDEWTNWYRYLLAQLVTRHDEASFDSLYQRLVTAFMAVHPLGIEEVYPGFANDALQSLGRCLMDPSRWTGNRLAVSEPQDPAQGGRREAMDWDVACGDFSAGMFFCTKYLDEAQLDGWLDSVFAIDCPLWTTQLYVWLLEAHPLLSGEIVQMADIKFDPFTNVAWLGTHVLKGDYSGAHDPARSPVPFLSPGRGGTVLAAVRRNLSEDKYFEWLDALKPAAYLQFELGDRPSRFADVYGIG